MENVCITLTAGDQSENHVNMQKLGNGLFDSGFDYNDLIIIKKKFEDMNCNCILENLNNYLPKSNTILEVPDDTQNAYILIIRNGLNKIFEYSNDANMKNKTAIDMFNEQNNLRWDDKYYDARRKKVLNKHARHNLCYSNFSQEPDYENKKGTVINYNTIPITQYVMKQFEHYFGPKVKALELEGNKYYDIRKCGIGAHGDSERKIVIAIRLGASIPLHYRWFYKSKPLGNLCRFTLNNGDLYVMSEKSTGHDWKKKNIKTLRHCAGAEKYLKI
jgi:hypothetical protein